MEQVVALVVLYFSGLTLLVELAVEREQLLERLILVMEAVVDMGMVL
jgi:hypothetical protein